ncbi:MAG: hypothetical protein EOR00_09210 [Mesorhizobium sp.]|uniref:hypothetical protein n=1 Tax=Mesorhizobium sp. TaxID=1871066 RepID=UPI000FE45CCA|nr:hypothetical protein [Mesorhizobium sp.]RWP19275.1 MAG: hypothetical protein EOR00_09210 [Mesorhizobium sp.]
MRFGLVALFMVLAAHVSAQEAKGAEVRAPSPQETENGQTDISKDDAWNSALPVKIIEDPEQANHATEREIKSDEHEASDLQAQVTAATAAERAAASAERQEVVAERQFWLSLAGIVALVLTVFYSIKSTNAAVTAAAAATDANQIASRTSQTELRAWIGFSGWRIEALGKKGAIDAFQFTFDWRNAGNTPASNAVGVAGLASGPNFKNGEPEFARFEGNSYVIAPSSVFSTGEIIFRLDEIIEMRSKPSVLRCVVRYDCVFDDIKTRISDITFAVRYIGKAEIDELRIGKLESGNFLVFPTGKNAMT